MKILQLNIWGGKLGKQIAEVLEREKPDVVCFQEAISLPVIDELFFSPIEKFLADGPYASLFYTPTFGFSFMNQKAAFGNAILGKMEFVSTNALFTGKTYVESMDLLDRDFNIRNLQHVVVFDGERRIHVLNHHGHHVREHKNGNDETMRQCKEIVEYIQTLEGSVVLCGDFNLAPDSESLEQINSVLVNHAKEREVLTTRTPLTHKTEVCDYIFTSPDLIVTDFQVLDDLASDHKALTVTF